MEIKEDTSSSGSKATGASPLKRIPGYLSVKEAAKIMGVSERSVYGYLHHGKLPGARIGPIKVVEAEAVRHFKRRAPGRLRSVTPSWHLPPDKNPHYLTIITVRLRAGCAAILESRLREIHLKKQHTFPGTAARYIARNLNDPEEIEMVLSWRDQAMPSEQERETALTALRSELNDVLDWRTVRLREACVLMHA